MNSIENQNRKVKILNSLRNVNIQGAKNIVKLQNTKFQKLDREVLIKTFIEQSNENGTLVTRIKSFDEGNRVIESFLSQYEQIGLFLPPINERQSNITGKLWEKIADVKKVSVFEKLDGKDKMLDRKAMVQKLDLAITSARTLIAETGGIVLNSNSDGGRLASVLVPNHCIIATEKQIIATMDDFFTDKSIFTNDDFQNSIIFLIRGPSRTADIEKTIILGVHGPISVQIFLFPS